MVKTVLCALVLGAMSLFQARIPGPGGASRASGGTFTVNQVVAGRGVWADVMTCASTVCTITVASTGSGHAIGIFEYDTNGSGITISSIGSGCSASWTTGAFAVHSGAFGDYNFANCTSSTSGVTSIAITLSSAPSDTTVYLIEAAYSGASNSFDVGASHTNSSASTSQAGPALTLTGTANDLIFQTCALGSGSPTAAASPYNTNFLIDETGHGSNGLGIGFSYVVNSLSGTATSWTSASSTSLCAATAIKGN